MSKIQKNIGLNSKITRRDFVGGSLLGTGAALLTTKAPGLLRQAEAARSIPSPLTGLGPDWTGPGGIGDYAKSNGNTHSVVNAAHGVRNKAYEKGLSQAEELSEVYDLVVVGGGFSGFSAAYTFAKENADAKILILDNHPMFGGEAKTNEFNVNGTRLMAAQGSTGMVSPESIIKKIGAWHRYPDELGIPAEFEWQKLTGTTKHLRVSKDVYGPMHVAWESADTGFFYEDKGWVINPYSNRFSEAPVSDQLKQDLIWMEVFRDPPFDHDTWYQYLDSMTYKKFLTDIVKIKDYKGVAEYLAPVGASMGMGLGPDVCSAASAYNFVQPGVAQYKRYHGWGDITDSVYLTTLPGGNAGVLRHFLKKLIPDAIAGNYDFGNILFNKVNFNALDRPGNNVRVRLSSLVVDVRHDGNAESAKTVSVTYFNNNDKKLHRLKGKRVVMASHQHLNKHIVKGLPKEYYTAMGGFMHAPMLTLNIALTNWKFMEKLGITAARWFKGFGWWLSLSRPVIIDGQEPMPLDPNKPTMLNMYIPFMSPGLPVEKQVVAARMQLFSMSYKDIEKAIVDQLTSMFASSGFNAERDIAGIVANRWGHAYSVTYPGFYYGKNGNPAPSDIIRERFGRIAFSHSELTGAQMMQTAMGEGERAANQVMEI